MKRRDFIVTTGIAGLGVSFLSAASCKSPSEKGTNESIVSRDGFKQSELGYAYTDLESFIDRQTMEIHYSKHHSGYVRKLNAALENHTLNGQSLENILKRVSHKNEDIAVLNNSGGHFNHELYWKIMTPGGSPTFSGPVTMAIEKHFGNMDGFLKQFSAAAAGVFGSGWAWLSVNSDKELMISSTVNQENPMMEKVVEKTGIPILGIDVWEHAYYLKYQNKRKEYIGNFIKTINWDVVNQNFEKVM